MVTRVVAVGLLDNALEAFHHALERVGVVGERCAARNLADGRRHLEYAARVLYECTHRAQQLGRCRERVRMQRVRVSACGLARTLWHRRLQLGGKRGRHLEEALAAVGRELLPRRVELALHLLLLVLDALRELGEHALIPVVHRGWHR